MGTVLDVKKLSDGNNQISKTTKSTTEFTLAKYE